MKFHPLLLAISLPLFSPLHAADEFPTGITQFATIDALLAAVYDGPTTIEEVTRKGNFGIGTFNGLDGELVMTDGVVRKVDYAGKVTVVKDTEKTPYATVFHADPKLAKTFTFPAGVSYEGLTDALKSLMKDEPFVENWFYAIRLTGKFASVKSRSLPKQQPPYIEMAKVVETQPIFTWSDKAMTLVGFWSPPFVKGMNVPGWHLHGLTEEKDGGGHLLGFQTGEGVKVELWRCTDLHVHLPKEGNFSQADFKKDREKELHLIESDRK